MEIAVPDAGTVSKVRTVHIPRAGSVRSHPEHPHLHPESAACSQTVLLSGLVSHISARLPSNKTAPHTPTWNAWASSSCQPNSSGTSGIPDTQPIPQKARGKFPLCGALCIYPELRPSSPDTAGRLSPKTGTAQFFLCFCCAKMTPHSFLSCLDTG